MGDTNKTSTIPSSTAATSSQQTHTTLEPTIVPLDLWPEINRITNPENNKYFEYIDIYEPSSTRQEQGELFHHKLRTCIYHAVPSLGEFDKETFAPDLIIGYEEHGGTLTRCTVADGREEQVQSSILSKVQQAITDRWWILGDLGVSNVTDADNRKIPEVRMMDREIAKAVMQVALEKAPVDPTEAVIEYTSRQVFAGTTLSQKLNELDILRSSEEGVHLCWLEY